MGGLMAGCAGLDTRLPDIDDATVTDERTLQQGLAFTEMTDLNTRLQAVAARVRDANALLCPKTAPRMGLSTHRVKDYPKSLREAAIRDLGARKSPTVLHVVADSPAEAAGLERGDRLIVDGKAREATDDKFLDAVLDGTAIVEKPDGQKRLLELSPVESCDYDVSLKISSDINAYATGGSIVVTSGMMNFAKTDDELAFILGHELAHNTMGHIRKIVGNYILSLGSTRYARPFESEADYVGMYYLVRAGYDADGVEDVWRRLAKVSPRSTSRAKTHPTSSERFARINATREEIAAKQASKEPLIPNFKSDS